MRFRLFRMSRNGDGRSLSRNRNERLQVRGGEAAPANTEWTESQLDSRQEGFIQRRGQSAQEFATNGCKSTLLQKETNCLGEILDMSAPSKTLPNAKAKDTLTMLTYASPPWMLSLRKEVRNTSVLLFTFLSFSDLLPRRANHR